MSTTTLPKPISAYVGFLAAALGDARGTGRSAAAQVAHLPLSAAGQLLTARHRYDQLAEQGDVIIDVVVGLVRERFGSGSGDSDGWMADDFGGEFAAARDAIEDIADDLAEESEDDLAEALSATLHETSDIVAELDDATSVAPVEVTEPIEQTPLQQLESFSVATAIGEQAGGLKTSAELPLPDFDHMSGPQLRGRLRTLDRVQLVQLLDYERAHAHRVGIVVMLENRLSKLGAEAG